MNEMQSEIKAAEQKEDCVTEQDKRGLEADLPPLISVTQACKLLGVGRASGYRAAATGDLVAPRARLRKRSSVHDAVDLVTLFSRTTLLKPSGPAPNDAAAVAAARIRGCSWSEVRRALAVSRQAAQQRFGSAPKGGDR